MVTVHGKHCYLVSLVSLHYTFHSMTRICLSTKHAICRFFWSPTHCVASYYMQVEAKLNLNYTLSLLFVLWVLFVTYPYDLLVCICQNSLLDTRILWDFSAMIPKIFEKIFWHYRQTKQHNVAILYRIPAPCKTKFKITWGIHIKLIVQKH